jgi:hypothetical protein
VSWSTLPGPRSAPGAQEALELDVCWQATAQVDGYCNQVLRATIDQEELSGPSQRLSVDSNGYTRGFVSRWPILAVLGARVSPAASFPPQWIAVPTTAVRPFEQLITLSPTVPYGAGAGAYQVEIAPGYINWAGGRAGWRFEMVYSNGWPHSGLSASVAAGASVVYVDDVTGWDATTVNLVGQAYDGQYDEQFNVISVTANDPLNLPTGGSVVSGPGSLQLVRPLQFAHQVGVGFSALPPSIQWATILYATAEALTRGATATNVQQQPGSRQSGGGGVEALRKQAEEILQPYRRIF